jgi:hypothetical protein
MTMAFLLKYVDKQNIHIITRKIIQNLILCFISYQKRVEIAHIIEMAATLAPTAQYRIEF